MLRLSSVKSSISQKLLLLGGLCQDTEVFLSHCICSSACCIAPSLASFYPTLQAYNAEVEWKDLHSHPHLSSPFFFVIYEKTEAGGRVLILVPLAYHNFLVRNGRVIGLDLDLDLSVYLESRLGLLDLV